MKKVKIILTIVLPLLVIFLPSNFSFLQNFSIAQQRLLAIFLFAAISWFLETIPIYVTSVTTILFLLLLVSNGAPSFLLAEESENFGIILNYKSVMANFAHPLIMLFIGGFFLAIGLRKVGLDLILAKKMIKPFGSNPKFIILGLMLATALFSMFMSNTATTAMMFALLHPILKNLPQKSKYRTCMALSIPFAANVGGIGTPIGTPPNGIALNFLNASSSIGFGEWMIYFLPYVIIMIFVIWTVLILLFKDKTKEIDINFLSSKTEDKKNTINYYIVLITFILTVVLWLTGKLHGINSYVISFIPIAVFLLTGVVDKDNLKSLSWDILWLVSGGFSLGMAMEKTGLSNSIVKLINLDTFPLVIVVFGVIIITFLLSSFMSHTAAVNLLLPLFAAMAVNMDNISQVGGAKFIILITAVCSSLAMILPISTPPNAIAYSSGEIRINDMIISGGIISLIGLTILYFYMNLIF